jgi:hypothetical protein
MQSAGLGGMTIDDFRATMAKLISDALHPHKISLVR